MHQHRYVSLHHCFFHPHDYQIINPIASAAHSLAQSRASPHHKTEAVVAASASSLRLVLLLLRTAVATRKGEPEEDVLEVQRHGNSRPWRRASRPHGRLNHALKPFAVAVRVGGQDLVGVGLVLGLEGVLENALVRLDGEKAVESETRGIDLRAPRSRAGCWRPRRCHRPCRGDRRCI